MWIENTEPEKKPTKAIRHPQHTRGELVEFNDNWTAQVNEAVGERMVRGYSHIEKRSTDEETES